MSWDHLRQIKYIAKNSSLRGTHFLFIFHVTKKKQAGKGQFSFFIGLFAKSNIFHLAHQIICDNIRLDHPEITTMILLQIPSRSELKVDIKSCFLVWDRLYTHSCVTGVVRCTVPGNVLCFKNIQRNLYLT